MLIRNSIYNKAFHQFRILDSYLYSGSRLLVAFSCYSTYFYCYSSWVDFFLIWIKSFFYYSLVKITYSRTKLFFYKFLVTSPNFYFNSKFWSSKSFLNKIVEQRPISNSNYLGEIEGAYFKGLAFIIFGVIHYFVINVIQVFLYPVHYQIL